MADHTFLYTGSVEKLRALRESGELGHIYYIDSVRVNLGLFQESNVLWDLGPHDVSIINYVLGEEPQSVSLQLAACVHAETPDVAFLTMWYPSGCIAHVHLSWLSPVKVRRTTISASRKMAVWDDVDPNEKIYIYDKGVVLDPSSTTLQQQMVSYRLGDLNVPLVDNREALGKLVDDFARCDSRRDADALGRPIWRRRGARHRGRPALGAAAERASRTRHGAGGDFFERPS